MRKNNRPEKMKTKNSCLRTLNEIKCLYTDNQRSKKKKIKRIIR